MCGVGWQCALSIVVGWQKYFHSLFRLFNIREINLVMLETSPLHLDPRASSTSAVAQNIFPTCHNLPSCFIDNLCAHTTLLSCWKAAFIAERSYTSIWTLDEGGGSQSTSEFSVIWCCGCLVFGLYQHLLFSIIKCNASLPILKLKLTLKIETKIHQLKLGPT